MYRIVTGVTPDVGVPSTYLVKDMVPDEFVNMITQQRFNIDSTNLQDSCIMASSLMVLHMDHIVCKLHAHYDHN